MKLLRENNTYPLFILLIISVLMICLAWKINPHGKLCYGSSPWYLNCDYSLWYDASLDFPKAFSRGNILVHRPLFAGIESTLFNVAKSTFNVIGISRVDSYTFVYTWRFQNIAFYLLTVFVAYSVGNRLWGKIEGFVMASLIATSPHMFGWLMQPLNNVQGFFITYAAWWMVLNWHEEVRQSRKLYKLAFYSLIFGTLMLGKAMYNLLAIILLAGLIYKNRTYLKETIIFLFIQFLPLFLWIFYLYICLNTPYRNYEARLGVFYFLSKYFNATTITGMTIQFLYLVKLNILLIKDGIGLIPLAMSIIYVVSNKLSFESKLMISYFLITGIFLLSSGFLIIRHAPDYWSIAYGSTAYFVGKMTKSLKPNIVITFIALIMILLLPSTLSFDNVEGASIF